MPQADPTMAELMERLQKVDSGISSDSSDAKVDIEQSGHPGNPAGQVRPAHSDTDHDADASSLEETDKVHELFSSSLAVETLRLLICTSP